MTRSWTDSGKWKGSTGPIPGCLGRNHPPSWRQSPEGRRRPTSPWARSRRLLSRPLRYWSLGRRRETGGRRSRPDRCRHLRSPASSGLLRWGMRLPWDLFAGRKWAHRSLVGSIHVLEPPVSGNRGSHHCVVAPGFQCSFWVEGGSSSSSGKC